MPKPVETFIAAFIFSLYFQHKRIAAASQFDIERDPFDVPPGVISETVEQIVEIQNTRPFEVSIEVSEFDLKRYGIQFSQVDQLVHRHATHFRDIVLVVIRHELGKFLKTHGL